jgi:2-polyprenyl-3-methyl-5-hydroxy-6-metoxy-1,4-benzoquinol methylase
MGEEKRFQGKMSEAYDLIKPAVPDSVKLVEKISEVVARYVSPHSHEKLDVLDIGCGDGITTDVILASRDDIRVTAID